MGDSKSPAERRAGSSPAAGTTFDSPCFLARVFLCLQKSAATLISYGVSLVTRENKKHRFGCVVKCIVYFFGVLCGRYILSHQFIHKQKVNRFDLYYYLIW